ncbi:MAG: type II toxin-antitoxin system RelE/ParE family toxin, partial [bacterium]
LGRDASAMAKFTVSPEAREDLDEIYAYIFEDDPDAADRVLEAALSTFAALGGMPSLGRIRIYGHSELSGLRSFGVEGFRNYVIFYRIVSEGVEIVRVVHGTRDSDAMFSAD